jgi:hypothetical protein
VQASSPTSVSVSLSKYARMKFNNFETLSGQKYFEYIWLLVRIDSIKAKTYKGNIQPADINLIR